MTQDKMLQVEYEELLARAAELEVAIAGVPTEAPLPPCSLAMTKAAAQQLSMSADNMRLYLSVSEREWNRLAESLRNAAKAYEDADTDAGQAIASGTSISQSAAIPRSEVASAQIDDSSVAASPAGGESIDLKQRALEFETGDQGASFLRFAEAWETFEQSLLEARIRFRPFQQWQGDATAAVEQSFDLQRGWLDQMADLCRTMAKQARGVADTQRWAQNEHIWWNGKTTKYANLVDIDEQFKLMGHLPIFRVGLMRAYAELQAKSDEVMAEYPRRAELPLQPVSPPKPPTAFRIEPPPKDDSDSKTPVPPADITDPGGFLGSDPFDFPDPTGMPIVPNPSIPSLPTDADLAGAVNPAAGTSKSGLGGPSLKPAGAGLGAGMPRVPLQSPLGSGSAAGSSTTLPQVGGLGRLPGAAGGMGAGGMGVAPVNPAAGKDNDGKATDRGLRDEESLYTEERPWTQGLIGRRRPQDALDGAEPA